MRIRHHVNPHNSAYVKLRKDRLQLGDGPVEVELGCADARFLFERARHELQTRFIGLEIREPLVRWVNRAARAEGAANVEAHFANISTNLDELFDDGRLARVFVNFPDPWFKRRHRSRRLMTPELRDTLFRKLAPGGELFFQSDVFSLALDAMAVIEAAPERFHNLQGAWSFSRHNPFGAESLREVRCRVHGWRVWRMLYRAQKS